MPEPFVHFESVWKKFQRGEHHDTMRDAILGVGRRLIGRGAPSTSQEFWAVRDVSFDVRGGETLGIIGGNGAGKSTILKLLTRILRPNRGKLHVEGRVGALIEVSAGFHPDLTGRENIFLQGSLMGMRTALIQRKFDEIVEFSGISEFLDTPVKRYSSGMNARLGFSIAAHLDPDVLIIDEVLAVGDYRFQQKAFGRLQELARSGRPVIVVSHQLDRIADLCSKSILLAAGEVHAAGSPMECIAAYLERESAGSDTDSAPLRFLSPTISPVGPVHVGEPFTFAFRVIRNRALDSDLLIGVRVRSLGEMGSVFGTDLARQKIPTPSVREFLIRVELCAHLIPGRYIVEAFGIDRKANNIWVSPGIPLHIAGDQSRYGRAHLGGRLDVVVTEAPVVGAE
jgi:lipopolysaccharide transport system ATP-binding protein